MLLPLLQVDDETEGGEKKDEGTKTGENTITFLNKPGRLLSLPVT